MKILSDNIDLLREVYKLIGRDWPDEDNFGINEISLTIEAGAKIGPKIKVTEDLYALEPSDK